MIEFYRPDPVNLILVEGDVDGKCIDRAFIDRFPNTAKTVDTLAKENIIQAGDIVPVRETKDLTVIYGAVSVYSRSFAKYLSEAEHYNLVTEKTVKHMVLYRLYDLVVENPSLSLLRSLAVFERTQTLHCHQVQR